MPYAEKKGFLLILAMLFSAGSGIMLLMPMVYIHKIIKTIILNGVTDIKSITNNAIYGAVFAISGLILYLLALIVSHVLGFAIEDNIIKQNVKKLFHKPLGFFDNKESGKIRNIIVGGAAETHSFVAHQLPDLAMTIITPFVLLVFFFWFDWKLGLVSLIPMTIGILLMSTMITSEIKKLKIKYFNALSTLSSETVEYVRGIPVVKTYAQSIESFQRLYLLINKLQDVVMKLTMSYKNKMSIYEAVVGSTSFFLVPVAILLIQNDYSLLEVVANSIIYFLIGPAFGGFIMRSASIAQYSFFAENALNKIDSLLNYPEIQYGTTEKQNEISLEFKNVSFSYDNKPVIKDLSFSISKGETVALVGTSGGGKTTIAKLAARFYDPQDGQILISGVDIKDYTKENLMKKISFVFQNSKLFKMSLKENLLLANSTASDEDIKKALAESGSQEIISNLPHGLDTVYGSKGTYFSGGEIQRLAIARAFLKNAELLVLDEATAFADPENESQILESLHNLAKNKTTLMIAHRLSTIVNAHKILVIDNGEIVEAGKHDELLKLNGKYQQLWQEYRKSTSWKIGEKND